MPLYETRDALVHRGMLLLFPRRLAYQLDTQLADPAQDDRPFPKWRALYFVWKGE